MNARQFQRSSTQRNLLAASLLLVLSLFPSPAIAAKPVAGWASTWGGPGSATNDCRYPWKDCAPRRVTSLDTGRSIVVIPSQFCLCEVLGAPHPLRLIDPGPAEVAALGLPGPGMYQVSVEMLDPAGNPARLPDTATKP